jgi:predicted methyltransferase
MQSARIESMSYVRACFLVPRRIATLDVIERVARAATNAALLDVEVFTRWLQFLPLIGLLSCTICHPALATPARYVVEAVADSHRGRDAEADGRRHPAELAEFALVKPGETVVDLVPGSGYFTRIFSRIVGPKGHVYAVWPIEYARIDGDEVEAVQELARDPNYSNVTVLVEPAAKFSIPVKADVVWTSQNYHDYLCRFMGPVDPKLLAQSILRTLKPSGVFVVIDHAAQDGSGMRDTEAMHRADPQLVKTQTIAAGFKFDGESKVLRNPADPHDVLVFNPTIRGHTDQFAFRFRAPD